jgi:Na+-transporting methylmalonyl-CoA/oxaloacetate decarboxylase gamma subunit
MIFAIISFVQTVADSLAKVKIAQNAQKFEEIDHWGIGMTFVGMSVVFLALLLLYVLFANITKALIYQKKLSQKKAGKEISEVSKEELSGEVNAAIAMAIHLYLDEIHDKESSVLTINRVARTYSPWSSKIYGIRQFNR